MNDFKPIMFYFKTFPSELLDYRIAQLSLEEFGALQKLKIFLMNDEKLPKDFRILGKLLGISAKKFEKIWKNLEVFFQLEGENEQFIRHPEIDEQRRNYSDFIDKSRRGGEKSAEARRKGGSRVVEAIEHKTKQNKIEQNNTLTLQPNVPESESVLPPAFSASIHSIATIREYALDCRRIGENVKSVEALSQHLLKTGNSDERISEWIANGCKFKSSREKAMDKFVSDTGEIAEQYAN